MTDPADAPPPALPPPGMPVTDPLPVEPRASEAPVVEPFPPSPRAERPAWPWVFGIGFLVLAIAQAALWVRVLHMPAQTSATAPVAAPVAIDTSATDHRLQAIEQRLSTLEGRVAPAAPDLSPLTARVAALEQRPTLPPVETDKLADRLAADEAKLSTLEQKAVAPAQEADRAMQMARVQAAFVALATGKPLGSIPDAPPALARYATAAPPTEAALRLTFPAAARAAVAAGHPTNSNHAFLRRVWDEAQDLITVRQGDHVVLGDPDAGVLAHAQAALDAGDLAGAVADVGTLTGGAAQATAAWLDQARGLLAARAALADLAARG
jgi:hypothetical protein